MMRAFIFACGIAMGFCWGAIWMAWRSEWCGAGRWDGPNHTTIERKP